MKLLCVLSKVQILPHICVKDIALTLVTLNIHLLEKLAAW